MKIYTEDKLRLKLSILRMAKAMNQLNYKGEIELTTCELLLKSLIKKKNLKEFDKWMNDLSDKNGKTKY